jgi:hypothetical protein
MPSVAEILRSHVTLELEGIDRMYLNVYVPSLQYAGGVATFLRQHRGYLFASSVLLEPISRAFVAKMAAFAVAHQIPVISFPKGQRKDELAKAALAQFPGTEGVLFVGKAQEKTPVMRTEKRWNERTGRPYPWLVRSTAMVNHWYWYCVDADFGPFFLKFSTYFPYTAKLCLNGHEYLKRQLTQRGIPFTSLDNGLLTCAEPTVAQAICDGLSAAKIDRFLRKWLRRLPHPFPARDRAAGYRYAVSILQAEFSLTQVLDRPHTGRLFFEEVIRENLDGGRPDQVQLLFTRRITRQTPGRFRTRVITEGVVPSLHIDYKRTRIKQYHKEGRALRTETTINDTRDFRIGRRLTATNLATLRRIGFYANRRLLQVQRLSHDCALGDDTFTQLQQPRVVHGQRTAALRFADPRVHALLSALVLFRLLPQGFSNHHLRTHLAPLRHRPLDPLSPGQMTYDLRRLRLHGFIERIPRSHRYRVTDFGLRAALFFTRAYTRLLRPGLATIVPQAPTTNITLRRSFDHLERAMDQWCAAAGLAA